MGSGIQRALSAGTPSTQRQVYPDTLAAPDDRDPALRSAEHQKRHQAQGQPDPPSVGGLIQARDNEEPTRFGRNVYTVQRLRDSCSALDRQRLLCRRQTRIRQQDKDDGGLVHGACLRTGKGCPLLPLEQHPTNLLFWSDEVAR